MSKSTTCSPTGVGTRKRFSTRTYSRCMGEPGRVLHPLAVFGEQGFAGLNEPFRRGIQKFFPNFRGEDQKLAQGNTPFAGEHEGNRRH